MLTYNFENTGSDSLYIYLYKCIKHDIEQGILITGEKLPSKRRFAKNIGVSIVTIENAYARLTAEGFIYSLPKKGFYVADIKERQNNIHYWFPSVNSLAASPATSTYLADFANNQTPSDLFPFTIWSKIVRNILNDSRIPLMTKSPCGGVFSLRRTIAHYVKEFRGMTVLPEQIIIGAGTEYLYSLLIQLLGHDKIYAVENPGYQKNAKIYQSLHVPCVHINLDDDGIRIHELEEKQAQIVHITPSHQYPTGIIMPISRRYELLGWAAREKNRYIIEDDYDSELRLGGRPVPTLQSMDIADNVIYLNTFSKTLSSTVRISYMILPKGLVQPFYDRLSFYSCTVSNFEQYTLARFIADGKFENHINRLRNYYRHKRDTLLTALKASPLQPYITISGENAGLHFLLTIHTPLSEKEVMLRAQAKKIRLLPLSSFYEGTPMHEPNTYVMNYATIDMTQINTIVNVLYQCCI